MKTSTQMQAAGEALEHWARDELFEPAHQRASQLLDEAVDIHLISIYRDLDLHQGLQHNGTARALADALNFETSANIALDGLLRRLAIRHDFLDIDESGNEAVFLPVSIPCDTTASLKSIEQEMASLGHDYLATLEFLEFGAAHFYRTMHDDHEFMDRVLTGQEKEFADTWHRATNTDPLQDIHGIMGAKAVELLFESGKILEVGGGTGNGLRNNLDTLQANGKLNTLTQYIFTDVSMPFILNTKRELAHRYPDGICKWQLLNINKDWEAQRIEANSVDMIYGVNAAHIAMHTVEFMQECMRALVPGGLIVFSERVRPTATAMAPREIVLNQSLYHRTAAIRHPDFRPAHAYLTRDNWMRACEMAGFSHAQVWPSPDSVASYFPEQYAAVVVARK